MFGLCWPMISELSHSPGCVTSSTLKFLILNFTICKMGKTIVPIVELLGGVTKMIYIECLALYLAQDKFSVNCRRYLSHDTWPVQEQLPFIWEHAFPPGEQPSGGTCGSVTSVGAKSPGFSWPSVFGASPALVLWARMRDAVSVSQVRGLPSTSGHPAQATSTWHLYVPEPAYTLHARHSERCEHSPLPSSPGRRVIIVGYLGGSEW